MEIKYTKEGKKIAIISKVNDLQFVAQEIFIVENNEVPHSECFVVNAKDLKDSYTPTSWYAKRVKEEEEYYNKRTKQLEDELRKTNRYYEQIIHTVKCKTEYIRNLTKTFDNSMFNRAIDLMEGTIKYLVVEKWNGCYDIKGFNSEICEGTGSYDYIKLFTVFGSPNGDIGIRLNRYSDGSGSYSNVIPFKSYDEAHSFVQAKINDLEQYDHGTIETANKYGIVLNNNILKAYYAKMVKSAEDSINRHSEDTKKLTESLKDWQSKLESIQQ